MERKQIFSIKKLKIGVASVLIGTGWVIAGGHSAATVHASENTLLTEKRNTEASTLSSEIENKKIELEKKEIPPLKCAMFPEYKNINIIKINHKIICPYLCIKFFTVLLLIN